MRSEELKAEIEAKEIIEWAVFAKTMQYVSPDSSAYIRALKGASKVSIMFNISESIILITADNDGQAYFNPDYLNAIKTIHPDIVFHLSTPSEKPDADNWDRVIFGKVEDGDLIVLAPLSRKHLLAKGEIKRWSAE